MMRIVLVKPKIMDGPDQIIKVMGADLLCAEEEEEGHFEPRKNVRPNSNIKFDATALKLIRDAAPSVPSETLISKITEIEELKSLRTIAEVRAKIRSLAVRAIWDRVGDFDMPTEMVLEVSSVSEKVVTSYIAPDDEILMEMDLEKMHSEVLGIVGFLTDEIAKIFADEGMLLLNKRHKIAMGGPLHKDGRKMVEKAKYFLNIARLIAPDKYARYQIDIMG